MNIFAAQTFTEMYEIAIILPHDRSQNGIGYLQTHDGIPIYGPFVVLGAANSYVANRKGNPSRDPLMPFGDTPLGVYTAISRSTEAKSAKGQVYSTVKSKLGYYSYGQSGMLSLRPKSGQALEAKNNGRSGLLIHAGSTFEDGSLRPTAGCPRVYEEDMAMLSAYVASFRAEIPVRVAEGTVVINGSPPFQRHSVDYENIAENPGFEFDERSDDWSEYMLELIREIDEWVERGLDDHIEELRFSNSYMGLLISLHDEGKSRTAGRDFGRGHDTGGTDGRGDSSGNSGGGKRGSSGNSGSGKNGRGRGTNRNGNGASGADCQSFSGEVQIDGVTYSYTSSC